MLKEVDPRKSEHIQDLKPSTTYSSRFPFISPESTCKCERWFSITFTQSKLSITQHECHRIIDMFTTIGLITSKRILTISGVNTPGIILKGFLNIEQVNIFPMFRNHKKEMLCIISPFPYLHNPHVQVMKICRIRWCETVGRSNYGDSTELWHSHNGFQFVQYAESVPKLLINLLILWWKIWLRKKKIYNFKAISEKKGNQTWEPSLYSIKNELKSSNFLFFIPFQALFKENANKYQHKSTV